MADAVLYQGVVAPATFRMVVQARDSSVDLTTATAAEIHVKQVGNPGAPTVVWACTIDPGGTSQAITVAHQMALGDTVGPSGTYLGPTGFEYTAVAVVTLPGGANPVRSNPASFLHAVLQP